MRLTSHKTKRDSNLELQMTSMIDVVFLLLIFFMTTMTFIKPELEQNPAIEVEKKSSTPTNSDLEPTIVDVTERGGRFVYLVGENEITSYDELVQMLSRFENKFDGAFVRVSDEPPFEMAASAVQACKSAGYIGVTYVPNSK
jgi:biopolymer transport protein ExbD